RRNGPDVDSGIHELAPERAALWRAAGAEQATNRRTPRRRAGENLAQELRYSTARARSLRREVAGERSPLRGSGSRRYTSDRVPERYGKSRIAVLERDDRPGHS